MHTISVKKLRENLPKIRKALKQGEYFLIIYQSVPIAKLTPVNEQNVFEEVSDEDIQKAALFDTGEDFLTRKEIDYYLSLKDIR